MPFCTLYNEVSEHHSLQYPSSGWGGFRVCHVFLSVHCSLVVICWERASLLALLNVMFSCELFFTFPFGVLGQVWYLIVLIPDICLLAYFSSKMAVSYNDNTAHTRSLIRAFTSRLNML